MKRNVLRILALLLIAALLGGCGGDQEITESLIWESAPALNFGTMEYEKLSVEPWYSGRCEATSAASMFAETELGYYMVGMSLLYYADKVDLSLWVPVCNKPACKHLLGSWNYTMPRCNAWIDSFVIRDGRIYYFETSSKLWEEYRTITGGECFCIASRALDGTDLRLEYTDDSMILPGGTITHSPRITHEHWLCDREDLNQDGSKTYRITRLTDEGNTLWMERSTEEFALTHLPYSQYETTGNTTFFNYLLDENTNFRYRFENDKLVKYDFTGVDSSSDCYLSGNEIRYYRQNDGYYDMNLETREVVRVGDAQLPDATSTIVLPNCIIETTLPTSYAGLDGILDNLPEEPYAMKLFDGESWRDVQLPEELLEQIIIKWHYIQSVTSDSIFFSYMDIMNDTHICRIPLGTDTLVAEECFTIRW